MKKNAFAVKTQMENANVNMTNEQKAMIYEQCVRESDVLQREISHLKSMYAGNIPPDVDRQIKDKEYRISILVGRVESLFKN